MKQGFRPVCLFALCMWLMFAVIHTAGASGNKETELIDETQVVTLEGNVHPLARPEFDQGNVTSETELTRMVLILKQSPKRRSDLERLMSDQLDPSSPRFHQWIMPAEYGKRFGASEDDLNMVSHWLESHGMKIEDIPEDHQLIIFAGTVGQVNATFHVEMHSYQIAGESHIANSQDPQIPSALASIIEGLVSLHDFRRVSDLSPKSPFRVRNGRVESGDQHLTPQDFGSRYHFSPVYARKTNGSGISVAIIGRSDIELRDVAVFREQQGLPAKRPSVLVYGKNPGLVPGDEDQAVQGVEWAGAIAPKADIKLVLAASSETTDGVDLAAQYAVNKAAAQVISIGFSSCERQMGSSEMFFYSMMLRQASVQGISALVSSGNAGAEGCNVDSSGDPNLTSVNGLCSSPNAVCVGGTEFESSPEDFLQSNEQSSLELKGANSYIPEKVWNQSSIQRVRGSMASGGGISAFYPQPSWQQETSGNSLSNGMRTVPDISFNASESEGYLICVGGLWYVAGGTAAATNSFAGIMALVLESNGKGGQGNVNPRLYRLQALESGIFHATISGNNRMNGVTGFDATGSAYSLATGLGSVDGDLLIRNWDSADFAKTHPNAATEPSVDFSLGLSSKSGAVLAGTSTTFSVKVSESSSAQNSVSLTASAPQGITATLDQQTILPGSPVTVKVSTTSSAISGLQQVAFTGTDASGSQTISYNLTVIPPPTLAITIGSSNLTIIQGSSVSTSLTVSTGGSFKGRINLSITGLPDGVKAEWSSNPLVGESSVSSTSVMLTLTAASSTLLAISPLSVIATGDGLSASQNTVLQVNQAPGFNLILPQKSIVMLSDGSQSVSIVAKPVGGLVVPANGAGAKPSIIAGLPHGIVASWSSPTVNKWGSVEWTLNLQGTSDAVATSTTLAISVELMDESSGLEYSANGTESLQVSLTPPQLAISAKDSLVTVVQGMQTTADLKLIGSGSFHGPVILTISALESGLSHSWSTNPIMQVTGNETVSLTLNAKASAALSSEVVTVTATGDGLIRSCKFFVKVVQAPGVQVEVTKSAIAMESMGTQRLTITAIPIGGARIQANAASAAIESGLPAGITAGWSSPSLTSSGALQWTLTLTGGVDASASSSDLEFCIQVTDFQTGAIYTGLQNTKLEVSLSVPLLVLSADKPTLTVTQGFSATEQLEIISGGSFHGDVTVATSGLSGGISAILSSAAMTLTSPATATVGLTVSAPVTAPLGDTSLLVTVSGDGKKVTKLINVQVTEAPGFKIQSPKFEITMHSMDTISVLVTAKPVGGATAPSGAAGATAAVTSGLPDGISCNFTDPTLLPSGVIQWTMTLAGSSTALASTNVLNIVVQVPNPSGTPFVANKLVNLLVPLTPPTLTITPKVNHLDVVQGESVTTTIDLKTGGSFHGSVALSASGLPNGVSCLFSENSITPSGGVATTALTLTASTTALLGLTNITLTAVGDGLTRVFTINTQIQQAPGILVQLSSSTLNIGSMDSALVVVTATPHGGIKVPQDASGSVVAITSSMPTGFTYAWSLPTVTSSGSVQWTLSLAGSVSALAGNSMIAIDAKVKDLNTGQSYDSVQNLALQVTLTPPILTVSEASMQVSLAQGSSASNTFTVTTGGSFQGPITLTLSGLPASVSPSWSNTVINPSGGSGLATLSLSAGSAVGLTSNVVTITAAGGGLTRRCTFNLSIQHAPAVQAQISMSVLTIQPSGQSSVLVTAVPLGGVKIPASMSGAVPNILSGLPNGFTYAWSSPTLTSSGNVQWTLTLNAGQTTFSDSETLVVGVQVVDANTSNVFSSVVNLQLNMTSALFMGLAQSQLVTAQGTSATDQITLTIAGSFQGTISLSTSGLTSDAGVVFSTNNITLTSPATMTVGLTVSVSASAQLGSTSFVVTASGGGKTVTKRINLLVTQAAGFQLQLSQSIVNMQSMDNVSVVLTARPTGGATAPPAGIGASASITSGLPVGISANLSGPTLTPSGAIVWTLTLTGSPTAIASNSTLAFLVQVPNGDGSSTYSTTSNLALNIALTPPTLGLTSGLRQLFVSPGSAVSDSFTVAVGGSFQGPVSLAIVGLPNGVSVTGNSNPVNLVSNSGVETLTFVVDPTMQPLLTTVTIVASGDGLTATQQVVLSVQTPNGVQVNLSQSAITMVANGSANVSLSASSSVNSNSSVAISIGAPPLGVALSIGAIGQLTGSGQTQTLNLAGSATARPGTYMIPVAVTMSDETGNPVTSWASLTLILL